LKDQQEIIQGCIRNDRASQEELFRRFYVPLFCMCRRFFSNNHEAIESVNDGMLKVFQNIGSYHPSKGKFFNWIYTIVRNTALDKFRSQTSIPYRHDLSEMEDLIPDESDNPLGALEEKDLYKLLDSLNPATRIVCSLFYVEGFSIKDIAERLTISKGTVKWHLSEARKNLKSVFKNYFNH
jgi:RNA polymerase sigma factor (sigma-70 family)